MNYPSGHILLLLRCVAMVWIFSGAHSLLFGESGPLFIPNQGQWNSGIRCRTHLSGGDIYFSEKGILYAFFELPAQMMHPRSAGPQRFGAGRAVFRQHNVWVTFAGQQQSPDFVAYDALQERKNYFLGNDPGKWAADVPVCRSMHSNEIWPGIRMEARNAGASLKYAWQVDAGRNPADVRLVYTGADSLRLLADGSLMVYTPLRSFSETAPVAWQTRGDQRFLVPCRFTLHGDTVGFVCSGLNPALPLTIDPTLIFSTYSGSGADNWGFTATYDQAGNSYGGGIVFNTSGKTYSLTAGAINPTFQGGAVDMGITKFNAVGTGLLYSTYLGGSDDEYPLSLVVSDGGELYILGRTLSADFPLTGTGFDQSHNGGWDIVVIRFNAAGTALAGATFFGGAQHDGTNMTSSSMSPPFANPLADLKYNYGDDSRGEIILDHAGNVIIASSTQSSVIPVQDACQATYGGQQDALIVKFSGDLTLRKWATYLGGAGNDAAYSVQVNGMNEVFVTGGTQGGMPFGSQGYQPVYGGDIDGYIARISVNGTTLMYGTYLGTAAYDQTFFIQLDAQERVYVTGQTTSGQYPVLNAGFSEPGGKQFISMLSSDLSTLLHSTTIGPSASAFPNVSPTAFLVDDCGNIYLSGWGGTLGGSNPSNGNTTGLPVTPDAIQSQTDGGDFYLAVLGPACASLLYGTFYGGMGGQHVDGGTSRFDKRGTVYQAVCGGCAGTTFPTTPGVWSPSVGSFNCNLAIFKLDMGFGKVLADFEALDVNGASVKGVNLCAPALVSFKDLSQISPNSIYTWTFGTGTASSPLKDPVYTYQNPGTYEIQMIIADSMVCFGVDTATLTLSVYPKPEVSVRPDTTVCFGDTLHLTTHTASVGGTYLWTPSLSLSGSTLADPVAQPSMTTVYKVIYANQWGCKDTASTQVSLALPPTLQLPADTVVCKDAPARLGVVTNAVNVSWIPAAFFTDPTALAPVTAAPVVSLSTVGVIGISTNGCRDTGYISLIPFDAGFELSDDSLCPGETAILSTVNGISAVYEPASLVQLITNNQAVLHPLESGSITGILTSLQGCRDTATGVFTVLPPPMTSLTPDTAVCKGRTAWLGASGGTSYQWSPGASLSDSTAAQTLAAPDTTTAYAVIVTDSAGCRDTASVLLTVWPLPVVTIAPAVPTVCAGDSVILKASGAVVYQWSPASELIFPTGCSCTVQASPAQNTSYTVTGTDDHGCTASATVGVEVIPLPTATITGRNETCIGEGIRLLAEGAPSYVWSTGDTTSYIFATITGPSSTFWVTPYFRGCAGEPAYITVDADFRYPIAAFTASPLVYFAPFELQLQNTSLYATSYHWDFDRTGEQFPNERNRYSLEIEPRPVLLYAGTYEIELIASNGVCSDTAYQTVIGENPFLALPSAFTPNGDAANSVFLAKSYGIASLTVSIFSRWGEKIYESDQVDFQWDGTYQGVNAPEGVYCWVVSAMGMNGFPKEMHGTVLLIR